MKLKIIRMSEVFLYKEKSAYTDLLCHMNGLNCQTVQSDKLSNLIYCLIWKNIWCFNSVI